MRNIFRVILVTVCAVALGYLAWGKSSAPEAVLDARDATIMLGAYDADGVFSRYCSGAFVEGRVVTAGHCVEGRAEVLIETVDHYVYRARVVRAVKAWPAVDYAVLRVDIAPGLYPSLEVGDGMVPGENLYAWSGPWGLGTLLLEGTYAGRISDDQSVPNEIRGMHYATMNGAGGSSGSIILNEDGQAEAILVGGFGEDSRSIRLTGSLLVGLP